MSPLIAALPAPGEPRGAHLDKVSAARGGHRILTGNRLQSPKPMIGFSFQFCEQERYRAGTQADDPLAGEPCL
jgi:hypothetical protein